MAIAFVRAYPAAGTLGGHPNTTFSVNINTTGADAIALFLVGGKQGGNMTGASFSTPTLGGSSAGWSEIIAETICSGSTTGMMGAWGCLAPASSASISLVCAYTGGSGGSANEIAAVLALYSGVASFTAKTPDNDGGSTTTDTMTNAPSAGNLTGGAWAHGSSISSVTSGTLRGAINNIATNYSIGCMAFIEGSTAAFSSGSSDSNVGMQVELVASGGAAFMPRPNGLLVPARMRAANW